MRWLSSFAGIFLAALPVGAQDAPELTTCLIDTFVGASPVAMRVDSMGRLFVATSQTVFVHEPNDQGGYQPRKPLYRFPAQCRIRDVETRGNDIYVLTLDALYLIPEGTRKRENLHAKKLIGGVPRGNAAHGLQAMAWGPQGDLHFIMGDALADLGDGKASDRWGHWTFFGQPKTATPYNGVGGVFRCKADGSDFRIVARGLRNPSGLVFDRFWNLFGNDRTAESSDQLLLITPHALFAWPSGKTALEALPRSDRLEPMFESKNEQAFGSQSYYDELLLPPKYRRQLLLARGDKILRYGLEPRGASFRASENVFFQGKPGSRIVALTVGRGGRIFAALAVPAGKDARNDRTELVMLAPADDPAPHPFEPYESTEAAPAKLWQELSDASWQRRARAHLELTRRGGVLLKEANKRLLGIEADDPALPHLVWLAAMSRKSSLHLFSLLDHADPRVRDQVLRALTEFPEQLLGEPIFAKFLNDENLSVRLAAALAYFSPKIGWTRTVQHAIEKGPACSEDSYLRQSAALLLADKATRKQIEDLCGRFDAPMRLAGVLAAGYRLTLPPATQVLERHLPLAQPKDESACSFEDAFGKIDLRQFGRIGRFTVAEHWKSDMHTEDQERLFKLLRKMLQDEDAPTRRQAAYFLALLDDARSAAEVCRVLKKDAASSP